VSAAFAEDPVRILRVARFAARFTRFRVAPETVDLMRSMVADGEVDALVPERVWQELARGLAEAEPSRMFEVLRDCGALARILPEVDRLWGIPQRSDYHPEGDTGKHVMMVVDYAARTGCSLAVRFAALTHDIGKGTTPAATLPRHVGHEARSVALLEGLCERLRVPTDVRDFARIVAREHGLVHKVADLRPATVVDLLERIDGVRRPERVSEVVLACACDFHGRLGYADRPYPQAQRVLLALAAMRSVDAGAIARAAAAEVDPRHLADQIRERVRAARVDAVARALAPNDATATGT
jgi:tRNA nucleotidyltransferase (CCA-adding enzyme)